MTPRSAVERAWDRVAQGRNAALLGHRSAPAPTRSATASGDLVPLHIDCAHRRGALGFVRDAVGEIGRLLGTYPSRWLPTELRADPGLRRRLLEESATHVWGSALVAALRDLAECAHGRAVLVVEALDEATDEVGPILAELVERCRLLRIPVLMTTAAREPASPTARGLIETLRTREGAEAVLDEAAEDAAGSPPQSGSPPQMEPAASDPPRPLPEEVLRVLRALAVASPDAEVGALAALLGLDAVRVLEALQTARDLGIDVRDRGDARFSLPPDVAGPLAASLLPSLARTYHRRLAAWHGAEPESPPAPPAPAEPGSPGRAGVPEAAASHAEAAGDLELAARHYTRALQEAAVMGLAPQALAYGRKALEGIERLPGSETRRGLHLDVLATLALVHWQAAGTGPDVSLDSARALLDRATDLLRASDPPTAAAEIDALRARILYDVGSPEALEQALESITRASRVWQAQQEPVRAARLLNDEAAIWVRLGDPVRANYLLTQSLQVFARMAPEDAAARVEEAETRHLLARLVFHVGAKPGRERDALQLALDQARLAEESYRALELPREAARVRETLGRLCLLLDDAARAEPHLRDAANAQQELGDALGLARTTAALAELCAARGDAAGCLELLQHSVELNARGGSPLGLAYNRRALEALAPVLASGSPSDAAPSPDDLFARLEEAEALVGRTKLAGVDPPA